MKVSLLAIPFLFVSGMRRGQAAEDAFRAHSSLLRKSLQDMDMGQEKSGSIYDEMEKLDAILSKQADLNETPLKGGKKGAEAEMETLSSALDSLSELFAIMQASDSDVPENIQQAIGNTTQVLTKAKKASGELEIKLQDFDEDLQAPDALLFQVDDSVPRRNLAEERTKAKRQKAASKSIQVDMLGDLRSHPRVSGHLDMHDAMANGDMAFLKRKVQSIGNKISLASNSVRNRRQLDVGTDADAKKDQCIQLIECASTMSVYDLILFFHADDIDFDGGEFDDADDINNFDADKSKVLFDAVASKRDKIVEWLEVAQISVTTEGMTLDACDELLEQFHRNVEGAQSTQWIPATVIDVCRAQGTAKYIKLAGEGGMAEAFDDESVTDYLFEDLILCSKDIYDNRPMADYANEEFVFIGESDGKKFIRVPTNVNEDALDVHGRIDLSSSAEYFDYADQDFSQDLLTTSFAGLWGLTLANPGVRNDCKADLNDFYTNLLLSYDSLTSLGTDGDSMLRSYNDLNIDCSNSTVFTGYQCGVTAEGTLPTGVSLPTACNDLQFGLSIFVSGFLLFDSGCDTSTCGLTDVNSPVENIDVESFDQASTLVFGEETSIGLVCKFAEVAKAAAADEDFLPGYCCLDSPFEVDAWGTRYSCDLGREGCKTLAPSYFAGFSEESCNAYSGSWCRNPIDCSTLRSCVDEEIQYAIDNNRPAYKRYLESAPSIETVTDFQQCSDSREYFGFEGDLPDSEDFTICEELVRLRCLESFELLDQFANNGSDQETGGDALKEPALPSYSAEDGLAWRTLNYQLSQIEVALEQAADIACDFECPKDPLFVSQNTCAIIKNVLCALFTIGKFVIGRIKDASEFNYGEDGTNSPYQDTETYEAVQCIYPNMVTTYDKLLDIENIINHAQVRTAKFQGCNGWDSDWDPRGNGDSNMGDDCMEDEFPPEIVLPLNVDEIERIDENNFRILGKSFEFTDDAKAYLEGVVGVVDDCAAADDLETRVVYDDGTCDLARFTVTPVHKAVGGCLEKIGTPKTFYAKVTGKTTVFCHDNYPPELTIPLPVSEIERIEDTLVRTEDRIKILGKSFETTQEAEMYLKGAIGVTDDCAPYADLDIDVAWDPDSGGCDTAAFVVTPRHHTGCETVLGDAQTFMMKVTGKPTSFCQDNGPPEIILPLYVDPIERVPTSTDRSEDKIRVVGRSFKTVEEAIVYLDSSIGVTDDCAPSSALDLEIEYVFGTTCEDAEFLVTPTHDTGCEIVMGTTTTFIVSVDGGEPIVNCEFDSADIDAASDNVDRLVSSDGQFLLIGTNSVSLAKTFFTSSAEDNCSGPVAVEVSVQSNEYDKDSAEVALVTYAGDQNKARVFVEPQTCKNNDQTEFCEEDPMTDVRSYKVTVTATDRTGNSQSAICVAAIVPNNMYNGNFKVGDLDTIQTEVDKTVERFDITKLSWNYTEVVLGSIPLS